MGASEAPMDLAGSYARWRSSDLGRITDALEQRLLSALLGPIEGRQVLDVGCGDGAMAQELARQGAHVTGLDPDPRMIAAARRRIGRDCETLRFVAGRGEALPFDDAAFDVVLAVTVLCFVPDARRVLAEAARVLRPGGRLIVGELGRWSAWAAWRRIRGWRGDPTWRTARFRTAHELRGLATAAGLAPTVLRGSVFYPPFPSAARLLAPVDDWLGHETTYGAAFMAMSAVKPIGAEPTGGPAT